MILQSEIWKFGGCISKDDPSSVMDQAITVVGMLV